MLLGTRQITKGDTRLYVIDYSEFLAHGVQLKANPTIALSPSGLTSTAGNIYVDATQKKVNFYITGGSVLNEAFTATVVIQDDNGETVNDTIAFIVVSP